jgi:hypothetical protein
MWLSQRVSRKMFFLNFVVLGLLLIVPADTSMNPQDYCAEVLTLRGNCSTDKAGLTWWHRCPFELKKNNV